MHLYIRSLCLVLVALVSKSALQSQDLSIRSIDGGNNNIAHPDYGKAHTVFGRLAPAAYKSDGFTIVDRVSPRIVSNAISEQSEEAFSSRGLSIAMFSFLQFLDHDITLTEGQESGGESLPIAVPRGDVFFDPNNTGTQVIPMTRVAAAEGTGINGVPREQINLLTPWIDASNVYGSDQERADWLRTFEGGKLKVSVNSRDEITLPCNTLDGDCSDEPSFAVPFMDNNLDKCGNLVKLFVAGDVRANEAPGLLAFHTLFVLEHNRICDELVRLGYSGDEYLYQHARRLVIGKMQAIVYHELLPALGLRLNGYNGYNANLEPRIFNEFATAAYRIGHTMVHQEIPFLNANCEAATVLSGCGEGREGVFGGVSCKEDCDSREIMSPMELRDAFFNPSLLANNKLAKVFMGMVSQEQRAVDPMVVNDLRNFLFGPPGAGGLDLVSINLQRGRDHGLPDYNTVRQAASLPRINTFFDLTDDLILALKLSIVYRGDVNNIDPWIGMVAEPHLPAGELGVTMATILKRQFELLRDADRFWYENDPKNTISEVEMMRATRLKDIINTNLGLELKDVFYRSDCEPVLVEDYCSSRGLNANSDWINAVAVSGSEIISGNDNGYKDNTSIDFTAYVGPNGIVLRPGGDNIYSFSLKHWSVWIDLDQSGSFEEEELVFSTVNGFSVYQSLNIPRTAVAGETRMRVIMSRGGNAIASPCQDVNYGEVEDYTINIIGGRTRSEEDGVTVEEGKLVLYPTPVVAGDIVNIRHLSAERTEYKLAVFDNTGRLVYHQYVDISEGDNEIQIPTAGFGAGVYKVLLNSEFRDFSSQFLVIQP